MAKSKEQIELDIRQIEQSCQNIKEVSFVALSISISRGDFILYQELCFVK